MPLATYPHISTSQLYKENKHVQIFYIIWIFRYFLLLDCPAYLQIWFHLIYVSTAASPLYSRPHTLCYPVQSGSHLLTACKLTTLCETLTKLTLPKPIQQTVSIFKTMSSRIVCSALNQICFIVIQAKKKGAILQALITLTDSKHIFVTSFSRYPFVSGSKTNIITCTDPQCTHSKSKKDTTEHGYSRKTGKELGIWIRFVKCFTKLEKEKKKLLTIAIGQCSKYVCGCAKCLSVLHLFIP